MDLSFDRTAQEWIDAGLARRTSKGGGKDLTLLSFKDAHANALVEWTAKGAQEHERKGQTKPTQR
jgi:hypothetical protein